MLFVTFRVLSQAAQAVMAALCVTVVARTCLEGISLINSKAKRHWLQAYTELGTLAKIVFLLFLRNYSTQKLQIISTYP